MNISLVRLSRVALAVIALLTLVLLVGAAIFFERVRDRQSEMAQILDLQRRISAFSVAGDTVLLHGADHETLTALRRDATDIQADLRQLADDYPDARNGIRAIERMLVMLEVAGTLRQKTRAVAAPAGSSVSASTIVDSFLSTMAAHGVALDAAVGEALDRRHQKIAIEATWLLGGLSGFAALFAGVSSLGFYLLYRRVGIPLHELATTIQSIEAGNHDARAPEDRSDELGEVGAAFNSLLADRQAAERRLKKSSALMRLASDVASFGGWRYDIGSDRVEWTEGTARIHGLPPGTNPSPESAHGFYTETDQHRISEMIKKSLDDGQPFDGIFQMVTATGQQITVRVVGEPEYDGHGVIVAVHGAFQDVTELMEIREQIAKRSTQLRDVLAAIGDGFFTLDADWRFTFINQRALELIGHAGEDLIGHTIWDEFPEIRGTHFEILYRKALSTGKSQSFVEYLPSVARWFEVNAHPTPDGLAIYFRDYTDQYQTRERLKLFEEATERLNDMVVITEAEAIDGPDHPRLIYVNAAFERITGYSRDEVIGDTPRILQGPDTDRKALDEIRTALMSRSSVRTELINYTKAGEPFWLEIDIVPLTDQGGRHTHFVAVERDITDRKRAEEKIRAEEERLRLVSQVTTDFIWDWDIKRDIWKRSEDHRAILGLTADAPKATFAESMELIHPDDRDRVRKDLTQAVEGSGESWESEYRVIDKDGKPRQVVTRAAIIRDDAGHATRLVGGMSDVTEIRRLDEQLHEAQKLESIGQLTGGIAHDFNNLLTIILGNADMLLEHASDETIRMLAETTLDAAERGAKLTDNLLTFARRQPLKPRATNVNDLIEDAKTLLRKSVDEGTEFVFDLSAKAATVNVDANRLQSAILNLVINSKHAIDAKGAITIETGDAFLDSAYASQHAGITPGQYISITVTDNGSGMSKEVAEQAFEPFFTTRAPGEGTGLGLSSVYGFVKQSGGHARIYSEPGEGTTVRLYLPVVTDDDTQPASEPTLIDMKGYGEEILVVEDDDNLRANVKTQLEGLGYRVRVAADADEALRVLDESPIIDLMFTDIVMPGRLNGRELAEAAHRRRPSLRILFTSGYSRHAVVRNGKLDDGLHLLSKPYRLADIAKALREALEG